jgi:hypothetical protein
MPPETAKAMATVPGSDDLDFENVAAARSRIYAVYCRANGFSNVGN